MTACIPCPPTTNQSHSFVFRLFYPQNGLEIRLSANCIQHLPMLEAIGTKELKKVFPEKLGSQ